jgi:hypothetical protein
LIVTRLNVATPADSGSVTVPPSGHEELSVMLSLPLPVAPPYWSSVETLNVVRSVFAAKVVGGAVENPSFVAAPGVMVIELLCPVPPTPEALSVAVRTQLPVPDIAIGAAGLVALNVATDPVAVTVVVPVNVQFEEGVTVMESVAPPPPLMVTVNCGSVAPSAWGVVMDENVKVAAVAAAGKTPTRATPASTSTDAAPTPSAVRTLEWSDRPLLV